MQDGYDNRMLRMRIEDQSVTVNWVREGNRLIPLPVGLTVRIGRDPLATREQFQRDGGQR